MKLLFSSSLLARLALSSSKRDGLRLPNKRKERAGRHDTHRHLDENNGNPDLDSTKDYQKHEANTDDSSSSASPKDEGSDVGALLVVKPPSYDAGSFLSKVPKDGGTYDLLPMKLANIDEANNVDFSLSAAPKDAGSDVDILSTVDTPSCDEEDMVNCVGGFTADDRTITCADACAGKCCTEPFACNDFTGSVCKDGVSCSGSGACYQANIESVVNGCSGDQSCIFAGSNGGNIAKIENSCEGFQACAAAAENDGNIGEIVGNSCEGSQACLSAGRNGGNITKIGRRACQGDSACANVAVYRGSIGVIVESCYGTSACLQAALFDGSIETIENSCFGENSCFDAARDGGSIGKIKDFSCIGFQSCSFAARDGGSIQTIEDSCSGDDACLAAALEGGSIQTIKNSCSGVEACDSAAYDGGSIQTIENSCFGERACSGAAGATNTTIDGVTNSGGSIQTIEDSCSGEEACFSVAAGGGTIGEIEGSCSGEEACSRLARFGNVTSISHSCGADLACHGVAYINNTVGPYTIESGIQNCCNQPSECENATEVTLPATCSSKSGKSMKSKSSKGAKYLMDAASEDALGFTNLEEVVAMSVSVNLEEDFPAHMNDEDFPFDIAQIGSMAN